MENLEVEVVDVEVEESETKLAKARGFVTKHSRKIAVGAAFLLGAVAVRVFTRDADDYETEMALDAEYEIHEDAITADMESVETDKAE